MWYFVSLLFLKIYIFLNGIFFFQSNAASLCEAMMGKNFLTKICAFIEIYWKISFIQDLKSSIINSNMNSSKHLHVVFKIPFNFPYTSSNNAKRSAIVYMPYKRELLPSAVPTMQLSYKVNHNSIIQFILTKRNIREFNIHRLHWATLIVNLLFWFWAHFCKPYKLNVNS